MNKIGGPAPALSKINFIAIQGNKDADWQYINSTGSAQLPCTGQSLYMALDFIGYPNLYTVRFFVSGSVIDVNQVIAYINLQQPLTNSSGIVYGFREYYEIPFSIIGNNSAIRVEASGTNGGKAYAQVTNLKLISK